MGHQVNFYLMPEDMRLFEEKLAEKCPMVFLDSESRSSTPLQLPGGGVAESGKRRLRVYLVQPGALESVRLGYVPRQGSWWVECDRSPVIEVDRCYYDGKILREGRLYYQRRFVENGAWVEKPESFQTWAKKVFSVARRMLQKPPDSSYYIGPRALAEYQQGRVKLVT